MNGPGGIWPEKFGMGQRLFGFKGRVIAIFVLGILIFAGSVSGMEVDAASSVLCARGSNVNDQVENVTVSHQKRDYNGASENWQVNNYQYMFISVKGTIDNQNGRIREGDYFTIELDKKLRPNGITDQSIVSAALPPIIDYSKADEPVVAVPQYIPSRKEIRYVFTDYIESAKTVDFSLTLADYPDADQVKNNGKYTFRNTYAGTPYEYTYDVLWEDDLPDAGEIAGKDVRQAAMITNVYMNDDLTQRVYTHKAVARFYNLDDDDKIAINYSGTEPYGNDTKIRIYGLTPDQLVNSFSYNTSELTDVTSKFSSEVKNGQITFTSAVGDLGFTTFYVELENGFSFDQNINSTISFSIVNGKSAGTTTNIAKETLQATAAAIQNEPEIPCREVRNVEITKRDRSNKNKTLAGAEFDLYEIRNGQKTKVNEKPLVTDSQGKLVLESLDLDGHYELVETKAPAGYELSKKATEIDISKLDKGEALIQMDVYNDAKKDVPPGRGGNGSGAGPRTGDETHTGLYAGALVLSIVLMTLLAARKRAAQHR